VGSDAEGHSYNVNADEAAGSVAAALRAYKVIFLTDVKGWLEDASDPASLISETDVASIRAGIAGRRVAGGMLPKLEACADAVESGVGFAHIVDGREPHSLLLELFTDAGIGTKVSR
jgi:acetylglutamate kinase